MTTSVVYFLASQDGRIKIGVTKHLNRRVAALAKESGSLELLGTIPGWLSLERQIHAKCGPWRLTGEWFQDCPVVRIIIQQYLDRSDEFSADAAEREWAALEREAIKKLDEYVSYLMRLCMSSRGMKAEAALNYLTEKYGLPRVALWSVRYRQTAMPNLALYFRLQEIKMAEIEEVLAAHGRDRDLPEELRNQANVVVAKIKARRRA